MPKYLVPLCIEDWGLEGTLENQRQKRIRSGEPHSRVCEEVGNG